MGKYLAILNGTADDADKTALSDAQQAEFMSAWAAWAQAHETRLVDPGAPLFRKQRVTSAGIEPFEDGKVAYAIVEAESLEDAAGIFRDHPHLTLMTGNSVEVLECPELPGA
ncbi:hypothetical protein [Gulosibacter sp. 10]|uniref:hypothetical protein n=1 Tax=Gulosibacter sp. 10 TaxID=1255570 RepID=UPI00097EBA52|nr:hypothetical protein [Gulosibacter sp. 10]SJM49047.1 bll7162; hypothetical protein [Gulosibacter sp. 10]